MSELGKFLRAKRESRGLKLSELGRRLGYKNLTKAARRIRELESTGECIAGLLEKVCGILDVPRDVIEPLLAVDERARHEDWERWVNEPITPYFVLRGFAAIYFDLPLPDELHHDFEQAKAFVASKAIHHRKRCCLVWSRRVCVYFKEDGAIEEQLEAGYRQIVYPLGSFIAIRKRRASDAQ